MFIDACLISQAGEEVLQRAKEAPCTCTVKISTEGTELLELRYITKLSCALKTLPKAFDRTQSKKGTPQVQKMLPSF